jgi:hypothetical protein
MSGAIKLEELDTQPYDVFSHQNEDIVRLTPEQLKAHMAKKEADQRAQAAAADKKTSSAAE